MNTEPLLKLIAFIRKIRRRGPAYFLGTVTYYWRRNGYFFQIRIREKAFCRRVFAGGCFKKPLPQGIGLTAAHFRERLFPKFHFDAKDLLQRIRSVPEDLKAEVIREARMTLKQRFDFRGIAAHTFEGEINWEYAAGNHITWRWDLNRHAYLLGLARAYYYTGEKKYLEKMTDLWGDWIRKNASKRSVNWDSPFEVAARLNNWIWCFFLWVYSGAVDPASFGRILDSLSDHAEYLYANLELNWPNNHLFLEAKALLEFAILFPELDPQQKFYRRAGGIFARALAEQILEDGCHSELCSMYHLAVAGELLEIFRLARRNALPLSGFTAHNLHKIRAFCDALVREDGSIPLLGDSASDDNYIRFSLVERQKKDLNYWIPDQPPLRTGDGKSLEQGLSLTCFSRSGYAFITERSAGRTVHLVFDFGDFSKNPASDHAHCDALSFDLWANGAPLIMDPGVYFASENGDSWYQYFRSTSAHNTLMVDGREQSQLWRYSDVRQTATTRLLKADAGRDQVVLEAKCRPCGPRSGKNISHRRRLSYRLPGEVLVSDHVEGDGVHHLKWFFHIAPGIEIRSAGGILTGTGRKGAPLFTLRCERQDGPDFHITRGRTDPFMGWGSFTSFQVFPMNTVTCSLDARLPYVCQFRIRIHDRPEQ